MEYRALDIEINSDEDLKDAYAVVSIHDNTSNQISPIDEIYGPNYKWNFPMKVGPSFLVTRLNDLTIIVELKADKKFGTEDIGNVHVPMKELLDSFGESNDKKCLSYGIITPSGEAKGLLYFTYEFSKKFTRSTDSVRRRVQDFRFWKSVKRLTLCKK